MKYSMELDLKRFKRKTDIWNLVEYCFFNLITSPKHKSPRTIIDGGDFSDHI